jgi:hypothetical protein
MNCVSRGDILPELARMQIESFTYEFVQEFLLKKVYLSQVQPSGFANFIIEMLDTGAVMRVSLDSPVSDKQNVQAAVLAEMMPSASANRRYAWNLQRHLPNSAEEEQVYESRLPMRTYHGRRCIWEWSVELQLRLYGKPNKLIVQLGSTSPKPEWNCS